MYFCSCSCSKLIYFKSAEQWVLLCSGCCVLFSGWWDALKQSYLYTKADSHSLEYDMKKITILCSAADVASMHIKEKLFILREWKCQDTLPVGWDGLLGVFECDSHRIIEVAQHHIYLDGIDEKMLLCGYDTDIIIVASKHKSSDGRSVLTAHFTGNVMGADFGGNPSELSVPAPFFLCSILRRMHQLAEGTGFEVNMESTHHGPTDVCTPMVYAEIGSGESQWEDPVAAEIVARSILDAEPCIVPIAIGFGGGHYASRQTKLILEDGITFGHNFPDHQLGYVDRDMMRQAYEKSRADLVYLDRKSMPASERERIQGLAAELGYPVLREGDIREMKGLGLELVLYVRQMSEALCPGGRFRVGRGFRSAAGSIALDAQCGELCVMCLNEQLLQESLSVGRDELLGAMDALALVYLEKGNGALSGHVLGFSGSVKIATQDVINECIKILKAHYEVIYIPEDNLIYIEHNIFDPKLAKGLGIVPGPLYGKLANGETVIVDGNEIGPEMVHVRKVRKIPLIIH